MELGLFNADATVPPMQGFTVIKLEPLQLDRESAYGTLATSDGAGGYSVTAEFLAARVFDAGATCSVKNVATGVYAVPLGATGKVVYGYNLRVSAAGQDEITFVIPSVTIMGVDAGPFVSDSQGPDGDAVSAPAASPASAKAPVRLRMVPRVNMLPPPVPLSCSSIASGLRGRLLWQRPIVGALRHRCDATAASGVFPVEQRHWGVPTFRGEGGTR